MNTAKTCRVPESPRYYIAMGKYKKAFSVLSDMRGCSCRKDRQKIIDEDKEDLELLLTSQHDSQQSVGDMYTPKKKFRRRSKLSRACDRCFPRELWTVPRLSYTRCRWHIR